MTDSERTAIRQAAFREAAEIARAYVVAFEKLPNTFGIARAQAAASMAILETIEALAAAKGGEK